MTEQVYQNISATYSVFYYGKVGAGKTLRAVLDCYIDHYGKEKRDIYSNISLNIPHTKVNLLDLIELVSDENLQLDNSPKTLLLDEAHTQMDSRSSSTWLNRHFSYFISQIRKMGFNVIYVSQFLGGYDVRARQLTDEVVRCVRLVNSDGQTLKGFRFFVYSTELQRTVRVYTIPERMARYIYPLYNTLERVKPAETVLAQEMDKENR